MLKKLKARAFFLKRELAALYFALHDKRLGWLPRITALTALAYAMSPIDLIPDFIPVLGLLDDLIILPALIALTLRLIPEDLLKECREKAESEPFRLKKKFWLALPILLFWALVLFLLVWKIFISVSTDR